MALDLMVDTMHPLDRECAKPETISGIAKDALNEQDVFEDSFYAWQMRYSYYTRLGRPVNRIRKIFLTNPLKSINIYIGSREKKKMKITLKRKEAGYVRIYRIYRILPTPPYIPTP